MKTLCDIEGEISNCILKLFSHNIYKVLYQNVPFSYHYQMEIHLGLLPYPKKKDTSEEVINYLYMPNKYNKS
jgi:hypothetical protein